MWIACGSVLNLFELSCIVHCHLMSLRSMGSLNGVDSRWWGRDGGGGVKVTIFH